MPLITTRYIDLLKTRVLTVAQIHNILPADCRFIAVQVAAKTRRQVSETTIKRLFGFALSQFKPSFFTLDVLAQYCDCSGWADFCQQQDAHGIEPGQKDTDWNLVRQSADKITGFTLQALKNRSVIPYHFTIERGFINEHLDDFLESNLTGTVICSPAGYGKTLALCHWVEQKLRLEEQHGGHDIVLFFSSNALMNVLLCGKDMNHWMLALLGYNPDQDLSALFDLQQRKAGKFFLIIDGLDDHMFKQEQFQLILDQLLDIFSLYRSQAWFKIILTMRSSTWINNRHQIDIDEKYWYTGFKATDPYCVNTPLFTISDIRELAARINPSGKELISAEAAEIFKYPLYLQFRYKQNKREFSLKNINQVCLYELISAFMLNKVYLSTSSAEKILLIRQLVENLDLVNGRYDIDKLKVNSLLKKYHQAYIQLLSLGFLKEVNSSSDYRYQASVQFVNDGFLEHSMAKNLLHQNNDLFDSGLIQAINQYFTEPNHKLPVIKWCLIHAVKTGQQASFEKLQELQLNSNEKSELILFLGDLLDQECIPGKGNEQLMDYFSQHVSDKLFNYFFGLELIRVNDQRTLTTLLKFELSGQKKIMVYTYLSIAAIVKLDMRELGSSLTRLKSFPRDEYQSFILNPVSCLDTLYHYFKYGIIKKDSLRELTGLLFSHAGYTTAQKSNQVNDMLYLLGLFTMMLCGNPKKTLRFTRFIQTTYKTEVLTDPIRPFDFFINMVVADSFYVLGKHDAVSDIYYSISRNYKKSDRLLTPFMKMLFHCLKIKVLIQTERKMDIINEVKCIHVLADESGYQLSKLYILSLLLKSDALSGQADFQKQITHSLSKMIRESELDKEIFAGANSNDHFINKT